MKKLLLIFKLNKKHNKIFFLALLFLAINIAFSIAPAMVLRMIVEAIQSFDSQHLMRTVYFALITTTILLASDYLYRTISARGVNSFEKSIQAQALTMALAMKKSKLSEENQGKVLTQVTENSAASANTSFRWLSLIFTGVLSAIAVLGYMVFLSWQMAAFLILYNAVIRLVTRWMSLKAKSARTMLIETTNKANNILVDILKNPMIIRIFNKHSFLINRSSDIEQKMFRRGYKMFAIGAGASEVIWCTQKVAELAVLYGFGAWLIFRGHMDIAAIAAFTLLSDLFSKAISSIFYSQFSYHQAIASIDAIHDLVQGVNSEEGEHKTLPGLQGAIRFENVSFTYGSKTVLDDISFTLEPGDKVLVSGKNGEGKTTLLNLVSGLLRPCAGQVYIDENPLGPMHLDAVSVYVSYITQRAQLVDDTSYRNVAMSDSPNIHEIDRILQDLMIENVKNNNPLSYSQGEQQRLCIGRGLYKAKNTPIVLCDEILSNVDYQNRERIAAKLAEYFRDKTVLMVMHDQHYFTFNKKITVSGRKIEVSAL